MPIILSDGENLYISAYDFRTVLQPIGTNPMADEQEIFLTIKNIPTGKSCVFRGTTPRQIKPANVGGRGPAIRPGTTPRLVKPANVGTRGPAIKPGTTPRRVRPGAKKCC